MNPSNLTVSYSDIENGSNLIDGGNLNWLTGNIDSDPLFVDTTNADYNLQLGSPCINAGDPDSPYDPDGTITDMGAFYFNTVTYTPAADFSGDFCSWLIVQSVSAVVNSITS